MLCNYSLFSDDQNVVVSQHKEITWWTGLISEANGRPFFKISIYCRGRYWKGVTIYFATEVILQQNLLFLKTKIYFLSMTERLKQ